jgi:hypothetical protein
MPKLVVKSILGANLAMLTKQGAMLVFYIAAVVAATAFAARMGPAHVPSHLIAFLCSGWWRTG